MRSRPHSAGTLLTAVLLLAGACGDGPDGGAGGTAAPAAETDSVSLPAPRAGEADVFRDVLAGSGIEHRHVLADGAMDCLPESVGSGVTVLDYDGDGLLDLYFVLQGWHAGICEGEPRTGLGGNRLYRNLGNMRFEDVTARAGVGDAGYGYMALAGDLDDDGDVDLYVVNDGPHVRYCHRRDGRGAGATGAVEPFLAQGRMTGALLDADGDGLLDIYVGNYVTFDGSYRLHYAPDVFPGPLAFEPQPDVLYLNQGGGRFRDATAGSGVDVPPGRAMGVTVLDYDGDGRLDLYVANDATANFLFRNEGGGRFTEAGAPGGAAGGVRRAARGGGRGATRDVNGDGRPDLHVTDAAYGSLFVNRGQGVFDDRIVASGIAAPSGQWASWGGGFLDFDRDGHDDLYITNGDLHRATGRPDLLFRGRGNGTFEDVSDAAGAWFRAERMGRGAAVADLDADGLPDIVVTHLADRPALLRNTAPEPGRRLTIVLRARPRNASGIGARVTVVAGGRASRRVAVPVCGYLTQGYPHLRLGLGDAQRVESVTVEWPDGERQELLGVAVDTTLTITQGEDVR